VTDHETAGDRLIAGRYRLTAVIGSGGAGTVWNAMDEVLGREVAVKDMVVPSWLGDKERALARERTLREARAACRIDHPNVVDVYDVVEQDDRPWIVMRLVKAPSLAQMIEESGPCTPGQAARIGLQVLSALRAAHTHGITHRDVKPSNVLVEGERAVLTDFGIATIDGESTLTAPNALVGAPGYIAPERVRGEPATAASDLWSLGATLYAAVEGRPPYVRDGMIAVLTAVANDEPDPLVKAGALAPVLEALLCRDPAKRPDAAQVERFLRRVVLLAGGGADTATLDAVIAAESTTIGSWLHTASDPAQRADRPTTSDPLPPADRRLATNPATSPVPTGRSRSQTLAGAAAIALLVILLAGVLVRSDPAPGSPARQPLVAPSDNPTTTSPAVPVERPVQAGTRPTHSVQPPPAQPSPTQAPPAQSPSQPSPEPSQPSSTTQQPEPTPTGTPTPTRTSEPPATTTQEPPASTAAL